MDNSNQQRAPQLRYSYSVNNKNSSASTSRYTSHRGRTRGNRVQKLNGRHKFKIEQRDHSVTHAADSRPFIWRGQGRGYGRGRREDHWTVSMQNSPNLKRLSEYLSNSTLSGPLDLTADPTTLPDIETRELSSYFYHALRGGAPSKKGPATAHKVPGQNTRIITTKPPTNIGRAGRTKLADHTKKYIPTVLRSAGPAGQLGYKVGPGLIGPLKPEMEEFLDLSTRVVVVNGDTYDVAVALHNARDIMEHEDPMPVCVLNFANAFTIGGGWKNGSPAQEEQLCYRSTLTATLLPRLYPMETKELIYSPQVSILRESEKRGYHMMWPNAQSPLPVVSVISMAAQSKPTVTAANKYQNISDRNLMKDKMRMVLRTAAHNRHQRLVLGALGCGAFGHPKQEVADCWKEVLEDVEFQGFFELIVFAIFDPGNDGNFPVFHQTLHNLDMFYEATQ